jgi:hypothetical protein
MILIGYSLAGLIGIAIMLLGARFLWDPTAAARDFGMLNSPAPSTGFTGWLAVKGTRDIVSGLFTFLLMANGPPRLLGEFLLVASLIAFGDAVTVLRSGGSRAVAFGMHASVGVFMIAVGATLIFAASIHPQ